ncbi:MAG: transporter substrate-binding domain-containing protein [Pseudomonadota bacterium]|nr:transporter substrate-binding domain-containing protein [Pseudomonadota bacterium]
MTPSATATLLAPTGVLRAGINLSNFLLVTGRTDVGEPVGVAPDLARAIAERLGVATRYVTYPKPGELADAADADAWDIGLIGAEPARAETILFTPAYAEIQSTYLVPPGSSLQSVDEVDRPGLRIAVAARTAYGLWLDRNIRHAELVRSDSLDASFEQFQRDGLDVLAGLYPRLIADLARMPGARILPGQFAAVQQAVGTPRRNAQAAAFLRDFVAEAISSGLVADLIAKHGVQGLSVAPPSGPGAP